MLLHKTIDKHHNTYFTNLDCCLNIQIKYKLNIIYYDYLEIKFLQYTYLLKVVHVFLEVYFSILFKLLVIFVFAGGGGTKEHRGKQAVEKSLTHHQRGHH